VENAAFTTSPDQVDVHLKISLVFIQFLGNLDTQQYVMETVFSLQPRSVVRQVSSELGVGFVIVIFDVEQHVMGSIGVLQVQSNANARIAIALR